MAAILSTEVPKEIIGKIPNVISKYILMLSIQMRNIDRIITDVWSPNWFDKEYIRNAIYDIVDDHTPIIIQMWKIQKNPLLYEEIFKDFHSVLVVSVTNITDLPFDADVESYHQDSMLRYLKIDGLICFINQITIVKERMKLNFEKNLGLVL